MLAPLTNKGKRIQSVGNLIVITVGLLFLLAGGMIYLIFRNLSLRMFNWIETLGYFERITTLRSLFQDVNPPHFVLYNLPDLLWIMAYLLFVNALIPQRDRRVYLFWIILVPLLAIIHEIMQGVGLANGSFDFVDLLCYLIPLVTNLIIINLTNFPYEKNF